MNKKIKVERFWFIASLLAIVYLVVTSNKYDPDTSFLFSEFNYDITFKERLDIWSNIAHPLGVVIHQYYLILGKTVNIFHENTWDFLIIMISTIVAIKLLNKAKKGIEYLSIILCLFIIFKPFVAIIVYREEEVVSALLFVMFLELLNNKESNNLQKLILPTMSIWNFSLLYNAILILIFHYVFLKYVKKSIAPFPLLKYLTLLISPVICLRFLGYYDLTRYDQTWPSFTNDVLYGNKTIIEWLEYFFIEVFSNLFNLNFLNFNDILKICLVICFFVIIGIILSRKKSGKDLIQILVPLSLIFLYEPAEVERYVLLQIALTYSLVNYFQNRIHQINKS